MSKKKMVVAMVSALLCSLGAAQQELPDPGEVEKRNAAAVFVTTRAMVLGMLQRACTDPLIGSTPSMDRVALQWLERNQPELDAADAWLRRYFDVLNRSDPARADAETRQLVQEQGKAVMEAIHLHFRKAVPTNASCTTAAKAYTAPQLDFRRLKSVAGYESFGAFADTLAQVRHERGFVVERTPAKRFEDMRAEGLRRPSPVLLVAADEAGARGDVRLQTSIYEKLALDGDAKAAQSVGLAHYRGEGNLPRNLKLAYRWFFQAWALGDLDGLNGLGVLFDEGQVVARDPALAYASFALAKAVGGDEGTRHRATNNLARLAPGVSERTRGQLACATLGALDARLEQFMPEKGGPMRQRVLAGPERRLGELSDDLAPYYSRESCDRVAAAN